MTRGSAAAGRARRCKRALLRAFGRHAPMATQADLTVMRERVVAERDAMLADIRPPVRTTPPGGALAPTDPDSRMIEPCQPAGATAPGIPRGVRNNNPGNIRWYGHTDWIGQTGQDADGFCIFDSPHHGIRAMAVLLRQYRAIHDVDCVLHLAMRWSPGSDLEIVYYGRELAHVCDVGFLETIDIVIRSPCLIRGIVKQENGCVPYSADTISLAIAAARLQ